MRFNPVFHFIGEWYGYAIGLLCVTAFIAGLCGCARRMCWEINVVGCTPVSYTHLTLPTTFGV